MSEEAATIEIPAELKSIGDSIANLTLKDAKTLSDYLKDEYGIEPAAGGGGVMVAAGPAGDGGSFPQRKLRDHGLLQDEERRVGHSHA